MVQARGLLPKIEAEKAVVAKFTGRVERLSETLADLLGSAGVHLAAPKLAAAILGASSSEQGLRDAAAEQAIEAAHFEKALLQPQIVEVVQSLEKARLAAKNARNRMELFYSKLPSVEILQEYLALNKSMFAELETLVRQFDRKITFNIAVDNLTRFLNLSTAVLGKTKKLISAAIAVKSGGASLLG